MVMMINGRNCLIWFTNSNLTQEVSQHFSLYALAIPAPNGGLLIKVITIIYVISSLLRLVTTSLSMDLRADNAQHCNKRQLKIRIKLLLFDDLYCSLLQTKMLNT